LRASGEQAPGERLKGTASFFNTIFMSQGESGMNAQSRQTQASRGKSLKVLPALGTLVAIGIVIYASQLFSPPVKIGLARGAEIDNQASGQVNKAVAAANAFLESLDEKQRSKAVYDFASTQKSVWSNFPADFVPRNGVRMGDLTKAQKDAALGLMAALLSKAGYQKVIDIMDGDQELAKGGGKDGKGPKGDKGGKGGKGDKGDKGGKGGKGGKGSDNFGNNMYFLAIFGTPSTKEPWYVQFGGHHLGVNVTVIESNFVLTPTHTGSQPATYTRDGKTVRPLGGEVDLAFQLMGSLDEKQRSEAILKDKVNNLVLGPGQDGKTIKAVGIKGSALTPAQQSNLLEIIGQWVNIVSDESAAARMAELKANIGDTYFGWSGPTTKGSAAYYRVTGPTVVIEYAPQGNVDHIHTIIRDPSNDYGQKLLRKG
jgi:Protein of unknown function (DUF3500)